jgi:hypothetical protein
MFGITDPATQQAALSVIGIIVSTVGTVLIALIALLQVRAKSAADKVSEELKASNAFTNARLSMMSKTVDDTHTLVNSDMGKVLRVAAIALRELANEVPTKVRLEAAALAEAAYNDHIRKQVIVDSGLTSTGEISGAAPATA